MRVGEALILQRSTRALNAVFGVSFSARRPARAWRHLLAATASPRLAPRTTPRTRRRRDTVDCPASTLLEFLARERTNTLYTRARRGDGSGCGWVHVPPSRAGDGQKSQRARGRRGRFRRDAVGLHDVVEVLVGEHDAAGADEAREGRGLPGAIAGRSRATASPRPRHRGISTS